MGTEGCGKEKDTWHGRSVQGIFEKKGISEK